MVESISVWSDISITFSPHFLTLLLPRVPERHGALYSHGQQGRGDLGLPLVSVSQLSEQQPEALSPDWPSLYSVLERFLEMFLSEEAGVRKQDGYKIIVSNTMAGRLVGWEWVRSHWDQLTEYDDPDVSV